MEFRDFRRSNNVERLDIRDTSKLLAYFQECIDAFGAQNQTSQDMIQALFERARNQTVHVLGIQEAGIFVAGGQCDIGCVIPGELVAYIHHVFVRSDRRNRGLSGLIYNASTKIAEEHMVKELMAGVRQDNRAGIEAALAAGFSRDLSRKYQHCFPKNPNLQVYIKTLL